MNILTKSVKNNLIWTSWLTKTQNPSHTLFPQWAEREKSHFGNWEVWLRPFGRVGAFGGVHPEWICSKERWGPWYFGGKWADLVGCGGAGWGSLGGVAGLWNSGSSVLATPPWALSPCGRAQGVTVVSGLAGDEKETRPEVGLRSFGRCSSSLSFSSGWYCLRRMCQARLQTADTVLNWWMTFLGMK